MRAAVIRAFGPPDVIHIEEVMTPEPQGDEVLVKVRAASVNPVDYKIRMGQYPAVDQSRLPLTLGRDMAGTVEKCGPDARKFQRGDAVYALLDNEHGSYAEYVIVRERDLVAKPHELDYTEAAAVPLAAMTAWQGLFDHGGLRAGQHVLIHGGGGGVGHLAIQLAKARGATVTTTVGKDDVEFARDLGADEVIDYGAERFEERVRDVDLVFDLVNGETQDRSWKVLRQGGALISTLRQPSQVEAHNHGARGERYAAHPDAAQLGEITQLIDEGEVRPHVQAVFAFNDAPAAQQRLEEHHVQGKIVIEVDAE
jgi:NADPH:quinone reductase-like Zn-dependent oxidoreductase